MSQGYEVGLSHCASPDNNLVRKYFVNHIDKTNNIQRIFKGRKRLERIFSRTCNKLTLQRDVKQNSLRVEEFRC